MSRSRVVLPPARWQCSARDMCFGLLQSNLPGTQIEGPYSRARTSTSRLAAWLQILLVHHVAVWRNCRSGTRCWCGCQRYSVLCGPAALVLMCVITQTFRSRLGEGGERVPYARSQCCDL